MNVISEPRVAIKGLFKGYSLIFDDVFFIDTCLYSLFIVNQLSILIFTPKLRFYFAYFYFNFQPKKDFRFSLIFLAFFVKYFPD